jgi:hypothetical protein
MGGAKKHTGLCPISWVLLCFKVARVAFTKATQATPTAFAFNRTPVCFSRFTIHGGDGIFAPGGCELYLDEVLIYSAANEIGSYAMTVVNCWDSCGMLLSALDDLQAHINSVITLDAEELTLIRNIFTLFPECLASSESNIILAKSVVVDYDNEIGALFTTPTTQNGFSKNPEAAPGMELERAMFALQQGIFDQIFTKFIHNTSLVGSSIRASSFQDTLTRQQIFP